MAAIRRLYDSHGQPVDLGTQLASRGEGAIYLLPGDPRSVAKVYHKPSAQKADKLAAMIRNASPDLLKIAAWPTRMLHDARNGPVAGFIMPKVTGHEEIHELYGPAHRRKTFPKADWAFLIHTAMNCAIAFDVIHGKGIVVGDVNETNIVVLPQALVNLLDCDSFQVRANGRLFPCEVGVFQYTPPELQGANFRQVVRTANHDRFGLAVLIFQLLIMGRHPFFGRFLGKGDMPPPEQLIKEYRFAFARWAARAQMAPPPSVPTLDVLSPELGNLFDRAFRPGSEKENARPTAGEWRSALVSFQKQLVACPADAGHKAPRHLGACPWCTIMRAGGPNFFVGVAVMEIAFSLDQAMLTRLWGRIDAIPSLAFSYTRPQVPPGQKIEPTVSAGDFVSDRTAERVVGSVALGGLALLLAAFCLAKAACFGLPILLVFGVWWGFLLFNAPLRRVRRQKQGEWRAATDAVREAESEWGSVVSRSQNEFHRLRTSLAEVRDRFRNLQLEYEAERRRLEQNKAAILRDQFLQAKFISRAVAKKEIPGVGASRQVVLESNGIETAYDIDDGRVLAVKGFGPVLLGSLLAWKQRMAAEFRFDPKQGVPEADLRALTQKYKQKQDLFRAHLERGALDLQALSRRASDALRSLQGTIEQRAIDLAQAEADLEGLSVSA
jgi:DNA-binding helix-hairpin-helix protein with protein kinase domain